MGNLDSQSFEKRAGDRKKLKKSVYSSRSKANEMAMNDIHRTAHRTQEEIAATLKKGFQVPRKNGREPPSGNPSSQDRKKSRSKNPKYEFTSDEGNRSGRRRPSNEENRPAKRKSMPTSSDEDDDKRRAQNDIVATGWTENKKEASRRLAKPGTSEFIQAMQVEFSESASPEVEDRLTSSRNLSKDAPKPGTKEFMQAVRVQFSESMSPEPEDNPSASQRSTNSSSTKTTESEPAQPRRRFVIPTLSQEEEPVVEQKSAPRSFIKPEITGSPEHKPRTKREFVKRQIEDEDGPRNEEKRKESARRLELLRRAGADSKKAKRTLKDIGLGDGLENTVGSPPKKAATLRLAARIAEKRRIKEEENIEKELKGDDSILLDDDGDATCPMCHKSVPHSLLMAFSNNRPRSLNTRQQAAFCVHHKRDSALTTYTGLGYPTIAWDTFNTRIASHYTYISSLITSPDTTPSHYRPLFASDITHGRNRTIKQSIMGTSGLGSDTARVLIPGYYGPRGARAMQEVILLKFNRELRKAAVEDNVVSARAVGGYVASVLVPELGTRLIMADLKIGEKEARDVMEKSAALGALVNEEVRDVRSDADRALEDGLGDYD